MSEATAIPNATVSAPAEATTRKVAGSAVSLGVAILAEIIGKDISNVPTENANQLLAAAINNELKLS